MELLSDALSQTTRSPRNPTQRNPTTAQVHNPTTQAALEAERRAFAAWREQQLLKLEEEKAGLAERAAERRAAAMQRAAERRAGRERQQQGAGEGEEGEGEEVHRELGGGGG